ncbi:mitochondrial fission process protein 1 [Willisornis vidua]|uniref:Mitochondrial fission process protein 1 n=1 Tax=Willisornis vidua TaxID=1566151 RepID=A0ABQ9DU65_9PASS|nr:mitochondrial fission process protein 1 [Willisornis vidua]
MRPVTETCDWSALYDGYRLFGRQRQGRRGRKVVLQVIEGLECMELTVGTGTIERPWVRIKGQTNNMEVIAGVCCIPPGEDDDTGKLFIQELRDTSKSTTPVLMGDFNLSEINWEHHTAGTAWASRFLKNLDDNFMEQVLKEQTQKAVHLHLLLINRVDLVSEILATATTKPLSLKSLLTGGKVPPKRQLWM